MSNNRIAAIVFLFSLSAVPALKAQSLYRYPWLARTAYLTEIEQIGPAPSGVRAKALRILKDDFHQGLTSGTFSAASPASPAPSSPDVEEPLVAGTQYLVLSTRQKGGLAGAIEDPQALIIKAEGDYAEDVLLALDLTSLPPAEQARRVAVIIANPSKRHTVALARFAIMLLVTSPEPDTEELTQAIASSAQQAFTDQAQLNLLLEANDLVSATQSGPPHNNLLRVFCELMARDFLVEAEKPVGLITPAQSLVLLHCWRTLRAVRNGPAAFRSSVTPAIATAAREKLTKAIRQGLREPELTGAREFLEFLGSQYSQ